jgi:hypothetical protein
MNKTKLALITVFSCTVLLTACVSVKTNNVKKIDDGKLADGSSLTMGSVPVKNEWQCAQIGQTDFNWKKIEMDAEYSAWGNSNGLFEKKALEYANENQLHPNYIYHHAPVEVAAGVVQNYGARAQVIYYKCVNPPKANNAIGSEG